MDDTIVVNAVQTALRYLDNQDSDISWHPCVKVGMFSYWLIGRSGL